MYKVFLTLPWRPYVSGGVDEGSVGGWETRKGGMEGCGWNVKLINKNNKSRDYFEHTHTKKKLTA